MSLAVARILLPVDFSASSRVARDLAAELAERFGASLDALHCWEPPSYLGAEAMVRPAAGGVVAALRPFRLTAPEEEMVEFLAPLEKRLPRVRGIIECGEASRTILAVAARERYDLIVLATHGPGGFWDRLVGGIAETIVRRAPCPVLTVPGAAPTGAPLRELSASAAGST